MINEICWSKLGNENDDGGEQLLKQLQIIIRLTDLSAANILRRLERFGRGTEGRIPGRAKIERFFSILPVRSPTKYSGVRTVSVVTVLDDCQPDLVSARLESAGIG
jgi:hypothetical protein